MHRCVCIWRYILQNYNYKLHFQNLSIYHISHVFIGTLAAENLDVCTACDPWNSNIQPIEDGKYTSNVTRTGNWRLYWYQNLGGAPPLGRACLSSTTTHAQRGCYLFLSRFSSLYDAIHGWMEKASRKTSTMSFTICKSQKCWIFF